MKNIAFVFLLLFLAASAAGQSGSIISETSQIIDSAGVYYLETITVYDNGTPFNRTVTDYHTLGDSIGIIQKAQDQTEANYDYLHTGIVRALEIPSINQRRNGWNTIIQAITGNALNLNDLMNNRLKGFYGVMPSSADTVETGIFRIVIQDEVAQTWARMIQLPAGGIRLRLTQGRGGPDVSPVVQYNVVFRSKTEFDITINGGTYLVSRNDGQSGEGRELWQPTVRFLGGTTPFNNIIRVK